MGVVWKARDNHLDRFVALKVLPSDKVVDGERMRRFVQEAKAASALNHPNIIHIYDVAETDGVPFIAMEYVAGKTLGEIIGRKGLRLNETLKFAIQIADALARAHNAGTIHRDLKPSNIMVDEHGLIKVLDFGLAKLTERVSGELGATATIQSDEKPSTAEGTIIGTVAYMSREQAEGKPVDARSDIFSFGSVMYEMLTGQRAFRGDSRLSTLSAILRDEPHPVSVVVPDVPRDLEKIISHCMRKDPVRRFQHMDDVKTLLEELKEESESGKLSAPVRVAPPLRHGRMWWLLALALLLVTVSLRLCQYRVGSLLRLPVRENMASRRRCRAAATGWYTSDLWLIATSGGYRVRARTITSRRPRSGLHPPWMTRSLNFLRTERESSSPPLVPVPMSFGPAPAVAVSGHR
jgi:serine/threonine protein kinase